MILALPMGLAEDPLRTSKMPLDTEVTFRPPFTNKIIFISMVTIKYIINFQLRTKPKDTFDCLSGYSSPLDVGDIDRVCYFKPTILKTSVELIE